jgi:hypothetical protein
MSKKSPVSRNASPPTGYTDISTSLLRDERLSWYDKGLLCDILSRAGDKGFSMEEFAEITGIDIDELFEKVKIYASYGYITIDSNE